MTIHCCRVCLMVVLFVVVWCEKEYVQHMDQRGPGVPHRGPDGRHNEDYDHMAVLGSEELDNEFEDLPEAEAKMRLERMMDSHDLDKDGIITKEELAVWVADSFKKLDREEASEKFSEEDQDNDGKVSWKEYLNKVYSFNSEEVEDLKQTVIDQSDQTEEAIEAKSNLKMVNDDEDFFKAADLDKDGSLDREEYLAFFFPPNHKHMHQVEMDHFMRDQDEDNDGKLSKEEFIPEQADQMARITHEENFKDLDKDKDGFLSREEVMEWVVPKTDDMISEEVKHLISIADVNSDNKLTKKEILDKTKEFVGSSITDYGNFMHDEL